MSIAKIPIKNIYYMFCYAWENFDFFDEKYVEKAGSIEPMNFFAKILVHILEGLIKIGFDREYELFGEDLNAPKGKINFQTTIKKLIFRNCKLNCSFDELSYNNLQNQIIKRTLYNLLKDGNIDDKIKNSVVKVYRYLHNIDLIDLKDDVFKRVKIHRNNSHYRLVINICELLHKNSLISKNDDSKKLRFVDILENYMERIFERFVRNFYKYEQKVYTVKRENIQWNFELINGDKRLVPKMQTDITLEGEEKKIIIDTKFYKEALAENFDTQKFRSENLYQLSAYLNNTKWNKKTPQHLIGILIYPQVNYEINFEAITDNYTIKIKTLDLAKDWKDIKNRLLGIVSSNPSD